MRRKKKLIKDLVSLNHGRHHKDLIEIVIISLQKVEQRQ